MTVIEDAINTINGYVWGPFMLALILGAGLFLMLGLRFMPLRKIGLGFKLLFQKKRDDGEGLITPFQSLMTSLSATIGTGNIAGVATAIFMGGPGALFWMWCTALVGMATKYSEAVLAVHFREKDSQGNFVGGPMYYIKNGLGPKWKWLAGAFAIFGTIAGFGIGNTVQSNSVADVLNSTFGISTTLSGLTMAVLVGLVLLGGLSRIAKVASVIVPFMAVAYLLAGLTILALNATAVPSAIVLIFTKAFTPTAAAGGFAGATVWAAIRFGVARGVFSNEAGLGSAPIAHAAAITRNPVRVGMVAMLGTFIDTIVVCSITGLVILVSGAWQSGETGASLSSEAFATALPGFGNYLVTGGLCIFAFTTILGWSYYGERCAQYLFGPRSIVPYRVLWVLAVPLGASASLDSIWLLADTLNAMMAIPNLIALVLLGGLVFKLTKKYFV